MVMRVDVVDAALDQAYGSDRDRVRKIALAPSGALFGERLAAELATEQHLALLCGRYEGFDERVLDNLADETISIGRYVLAGGELPAMVITDAVLRKLPGALGDEESAVEESWRRARGRARVPALHPARQLPRLGGARRAALGRPCPGSGVAADASAPAGE